jgi:hypothetical protein
MNRPLDLRVQAREHPVHAFFELLVVAQQLVEIAGERFGAAFLGVAADPRRPPGRDDRPFLLGALPRLDRTEDDAKRGTAERERV